MKRKIRLESLRPFTPTEHDCILPKQKTGRKSQLLVGKDKRRDQEVALKLTHQFADYPLVPDLASSFCSACGWKTVTG